MVECEVHSQDLNEDVDLIDFSEPDEEIQETEVPSVYIFLVLSDLTLDDHVLTLAQPFLTTLVKQSGSP
jgi:hypothetical protein